MGYSIKVMQTDHDNAMMMNRRREGGFSLAVIMLFTIVFAVVIAVIAEAQNNASEKRKIDSIAFQAKEIAKAARLYVRNNSLSQYMEDTNADGIPDTLRNAAYMDANAIDRNGDGVIDSLYRKTNLDIGGTGPVQITVANLIAAGYLPATFNRIDAAGNDLTEFTFLQQPIEIYAANSPVDGLPTSDTTVATAYVVLGDSARVDGTSAILLAQALQNEKVQIVAPLYSGGANISDTCGGGSAIAIWDTGCMDDDTYDLLTGNAAGSGTFVEGTLVVPSWKAAQLDSRAVMRFPQPESTTYATMLTDLKLASNLDADGDGNLCLAADGSLNDNDDGIMLTQDDEFGALTTIWSGLCKSSSDDSTANLDVRKDIYNVTNLDAVRVIAADQRDRAVVGDDYRDTRLVLDGSAAGIFTTGETYNIDDTENLFSGSDVGTDTRDFDDVVAIGGSLNVNGVTRVFNDPDYAYTESVAKAVFGSMTAEGGVSVGNDTGSDATATINQLSGALTRVTTQRLTADGAQLHVGIDEGDFVNGAALLANEATAADQSVLNLRNLTLNTGLVITPTLLNGGVDELGLTTSIINLEAATINADTATFLGDVNADSFNIGDQGSGLYQAVPGFDPTINVIISSLTNAGPGDVTVADLESENFIDVAGQTNYLGVLNITSGDVSNPANCSGSTNADCPALGTDPGSPF